MTEGVSAVLVQTGCTRTMSDAVSSLEHDRVVCLFDPNVERVARDVAALFGTGNLVPVPGAEAAKTLGRAEQWCEELLRLGCSRSSLIVNVGGGAVTDLGGFVAGIYMRGIDFVNVPTTMLAMCDAAIGGKTAVDLPVAKNTVGLFHPAQLVLIDPDVLHTLPTGQLREGLVEAVKMAAILDLTALEWMEANMAAVVERRGDTLRQCIELAVRLKTGVVDDDPRESGRRMLLNFGHTVGHGVEAVSNYGISHGRAVSMGMIRELNCAGNRADAARLTPLLAALDMPTELPPDLDMDSLWAAMLHDKKNAHGSVRMAVPGPLGHGSVVELRRAQL